MFRPSPVKIRIQSAPACTYSGNKGDIHVYFDDIQEFNASLDILINSEEKPSSLGALIYSCHNKKDERNDFITFSMINTGKDIIFKIFHKDRRKSFSINGDVVNAVSAEIAKRSKKIDDQLLEGLSFPDEKSLGLHTKKLLESFNSIIETLSNAIKQNEIGISLDHGTVSNILQRLCNLLDKESDELRKSHIATPSSL
jgi:hypothetical protein